MNNRTGTWALTVALLVGCASCDDDDARTDEDVTMGGRSGRGGSGDGGRAAAGSSVSGQGGRGTSVVGGRAGGGSGAGGQRGHAGSAGHAGAGTGGGSTSSIGEVCSLTRDSLQKWCGQSETHCDLSADEQLTRLCREQNACPSCAHVGSASNSCGVASISATYGGDASTVTRHYDAQGQQVGTEVLLGNRCVIAMRTAPERVVYGEECKLSTHHAADCLAAADGGM